MKVVCICGSFKFYKEMLKIKRKLEEAGIKCLLPEPSQLRCKEDPSKFIPNLPSKDELIKEAEQVSLCHFRKIDRCDIVYVINKGGYVGRNTLLDIGYAFGKGKPIYLSEPMREKISNLSILSSIKFLPLASLIKLAKR
jgi:nucleoside 2-deoxyribosyltransferase